MQVCRDFFLVLSHQFQKFFHRFGRLLLGSRIKVRIDVGRRAEIAVPQPLLNLFERHMVRKQQARAAVPLRYNKDKRKNPVFSRVSAFVVAYSIPFPTLIVSEKSVE